MQEVFIMMRDNSNVYMDFKSFCKAIDLYKPKSSVKYS